MFRVTISAFLRRGAVLAGLCLLAAGCAGGVPSPRAPAAPLDGAVTIAPETPSRPRLEVRDLPGLDNISERELVSRLGEPDFTRKEASAQIWQYRSDSCVLDVFLYPEDGGLKVVHAATRDRAKLKSPENSCSPFAQPLTASAGT
jgi:hypothetical protein